LPNAANRIAVSKALQHAGMQGTTPGTGDCKIPGSSRRRKLPQFCFILNSPATAKAEYEYSVIAWSTTATRGSF
jgi:hypothetical protein